jgi:hypothetical protein
MLQENQFVYIVENDLSGLKRKLKKGTRVPSRIVLKLDEYRYVLRIYGINLVMQSKIRFNRFDEVELLVEKTKPKLKMSIVGKINNPKSTKKTTQMDFKV